MAELIWTVLCESASIDQNTNNMSLFNIRERLIIEGVLSEPVKKGQPYVVPVDVTMASLWARSDLDVPETAFFRPILVGPNGNKSTSKDIEIDLETNNRSRTIIAFRNLPVTDSGIYNFTIQYKDVNEPESAWREISSVPLEIKLSVTYQSQSEAGRTVSRKKLKKKAKKKTKIKTKKKVSKKAGKKDYAK